MNNTHRGVDKEEVCPRLFARDFMVGEESALLWVVRSVYVPRK